MAAKVGAAIAERGWTLVWGGGNVSAMGALAVAARERGGRTVGVIPKALLHREVADVDADELIAACDRAAPRWKYASGAELFASLLDQAQMPAEPVLVG